MPGEQSERGEEPEQPADGRQPMVARGTDRMRLGGICQKGLFHQGKVLAPNYQTWRQEESGAGSGGTHHPATGLRRTAQWRALPGSANTGPNRTAETTHDLPSRAEAGQ